MTHPLFARASQASFSLSMPTFLLSQKLESWAKEGVSFEEKLKRLEAVDRFKSFCLRSL